MEMNLIFIGIIVCGFISAVFLGAKINQNKILKASIKKAVKVETKREKIRQKYIKIRSVFKPKLVLRSRSLPSKTNKTGSSKSTDGSGSKE